MPDLVSEENIVMSNGRDVIRIPIRSLDEYKIRYNYDKNKHVGQGNGKSKVGDVVARDPSGQQQKGPGKGQGGTRIMDILRKVEKYREEEERLKWEGTFAEYLQLLKEKPWIAQTAHSRVYYMIKDAGERKRKRNDFIFHKIINIILFKSIKMYVKSFKCGGISSVQSLYHKSCEALS